MQVWQIKDSKAIIPLFAGVIRAGFPSPAADYIENQIDLNKLLIANPTSTFYAQVTGDSMVNAYIHPTASHLIIDRSLKPQNGDIVVAVIDGEFTVKRYLNTSQGIYLQAENPKYRPVKILDGMELEIWGVVTHFITDAKRV